MTDSESDQHLNDVEQLDDPLPFKCEWEIGVQEAGELNEWDHYHPRARTEKKAKEKAKEKAKNKARKDGYRDPIVYMCTGPYRPENPAKIGEEVIQDVFGPRSRYSNPDHSDFGEKND